MKYLKLAKRFLQNKTFDKNGYEYVFNDVTPLKDFDESYKFEVKVKLPKKGQSYVAEKFSQDISNIIDMLFDFIGERFSYSVRLEIDTDDEGGIPDVYITEEKKLQILDTFNKKYSKVVFPFDDFDAHLIFNLYFFNSEVFGREMFTADSQSEEIYVNVYFKVTSIEMEQDGEIYEIKPRLNQINEIAGVLTSAMYENNTSSDIEEDLYNILEGELQISNSDIYFSATLSCKFIDGVETKPDWRLPNFKKEMFFI